MRSPRPPRPWPVKPEPPETRRSGDPPQPTRVWAAGHRIDVGPRLALRHESSHPPDSGRDGGRHESSHPLDGASVTNRLTPGGGRRRHESSHRPARCDVTIAATVTNRLTPGGGPDCDPSRIVSSQRGHARSPDAPTGSPDRSPPRPAGPLDRLDPIHPDSIPSTPDTNHRHSRQQPFATPRLRRFGTPHAPDLAGSETIRDAAAPSLLAR